MVDKKRPSNSELHLQRLEAEEARRERERGIYEIFPRDEDAPLSRDEAESDDERAV